MIKVFCHSADLDGDASGGLVKFLIENSYTKPECKLEGDVLLYPIDYPDIFPFEELHKNDTLILVDFSLPYKDMKKLKNSVKRLIWIDHHKTSIQELEELNLEGCVSTKFATCELVLDYLIRPGLKKFNWTMITYLGAYDCWRWPSEKNSDDILAFQYGMRMIATDPSKNYSFWDSKFKDILFSRGIMSFVNKTITNGKICLAYQKQIDKEYAKHFGFEATFKGYKTFVINKGKASLQAFGDLSNEYDICLSYVYLGDQYRVSLYSIRIDVGMIATQYEGGGGHGGAAGFEAKYMNVTEDKQIDFYNGEQNED